MRSAPSCEAKVRSRRCSVAGCAGVGYQPTGGDSAVELRLFNPTFRTAAQPQDRLRRRNPQLKENNISRLQPFEVSFSELAGQWPDESAFRKPYGKPKITGQLSRSHPLKGAAEKRYSLPVGIFSSGGEALLPAQISLARGRCFQATRGRGARQVHHECRMNA
jgi:hypothetical protein